MSYERYLDAETRINQGLIRRNLSIEREQKPPRDPKLKMAAMQAFLEDCGHPERGIPAVHIAGTSGKGSVAAAVAGILHASGLKVGLHISPYLQSATEKIWIDGKFISSDGFADLVDWIMPIAKSRLNPETPASIHGMASVLIALKGFRQAGVDIMVFEAGCGGRNDLSNILEPVVTVVTNVGMDHVVSLGPTISDIAWHKAGIAQKGVPMVTGTTGEAWNIVQEECNRVGAPLFTVPVSSDPLHHNRDIAATTARHAACALGKNLSNDTIQEGMARIRMAGRIESLPTEPRVIIDGAHNPEKLRVAVNAALAKHQGGKRILLFGAIGAKAGPALVAPLMGKFDRVVATEPAVYAKSANPAAATASLFENSSTTVDMVPDAISGFKHALSRCDSAGTVMVTGSFYLLAPIRELFYPKKAVVLQGTSFPAILEK